MVNLMRGRCFDRLRKDVACLVEIIASVEQAVDFAAIARPFLDLVEVAIIGIERVVSLFVGPIVHRCFIPLVLTSYRS